MNSIEVIDIESSDGEGDHDDNDNNNVDHKFKNLNAPGAAAAAANGNNRSEEEEQDCSDNSKSMVTLTIQPPMLLLENQRKSIDALFANYADCHNKLLRLTPIMNPLQRRRWQKHMSSKQVPIVIGGPEEEAEEEREFNFEEDEDDHFARLWDRRKRQAPEPSYSRRVRAAPKRRKKAKRRAARRVYPKKESASSGRSVPAASSSAYRAGPSSRPSTSSTADRKPSKTVLAASLARFAVKKER